MGEIIKFLRELSFGDVIVLWVKFIILCFVYHFICTFIDMTKCWIQYLIVAKYNYYTTKYQKNLKKIQKKFYNSVPYKRNSNAQTNSIDISEIIHNTPKLVIRIDIMTGKVHKKEVWKKRGLLERFLYPQHKGFTKTIVAKPNTMEVEKVFLYTASLINTLNLNFFNWQDFNPELLKVLQSEKIVAKEAITHYLCNFQQ